jgi:uncharacterized protein (DUF2062 family)
MSRLEKLLPSREKLVANRWLKWSAPYIARQELWRLEREPVAKGVAAGVFFAFATPVAQIPAAVAAAIFLRANVPASVAATLVNTPLTFGPVYLLAYQIGAKVTEVAGSPANGLGDKTVAVLVGTLVLAVLSSVLSYWLTRLLWKSKSQESDVTP